MQVSMEELRGVINAYVNLDGGWFVLCSSVGVIEKYWYVLWMCGLKEWGKGFDNVLVL